MDYEKKYNKALERFKSFKEKYYTKDTSLGDVIFDKTGEMQKDFNGIFPELHESEKPLTPFQQYLNLVLRKVHFASIPGKMENTDKFILDTVKRHTNELVKLAKRHEYTDCQLRENEDERIRKKCMDFIRKWSSKEDRDECLAYLEKQKEQKPTPDWMPKFLDELRSKKNYFDWDEHRDIEGHILAIINWIAPDYFKRKEEKKPDTFNEPYNPDEYEVVMEGNATSLRRKEQKPVDEAENFFDSAESYHQGFIAGQKKMKEDIEKGFGINERSLDYLAGRYAGYTAAKQEQKPAEWSEEDADMLNCCISSIEEAKENRYAYKETDGDTSYDREINWLKSLRPSWKPSEEQIDALKELIDDANRAGWVTPGATELYEQLKKL